MEVVPHVGIKLNATVFTNAHKGKTVEIKEGKLLFDGILQNTNWQDQASLLPVKPVEVPEDCKGTIKDVNEEFKGKVALDTGAEFWNPLDDTSQALQLENPAGI